VPAWFRGRVSTYLSVFRDKEDPDADGAYLTFDEDKKGTLEPGKLADFIVLSTNLLQCPENEIKDTQVLKTYMNGKLVFSRL